MTSFVNGKVFTGEAEDGFVGGFEVVDGRFRHVGATTPGGDVVDLNGATVVPGFIDAHTHPVMMGTIAGEATLLPPAVMSLDDLVETLKAHGPGESGWIVGFGYDESKYGGERPTRQILDRVSTEHPVVARRCDGHSAVANTKALEVAGITSDTPDPLPGVFEKDAFGDLTGLLLEPPASKAVTRHIKETMDPAAAIAGLSEHFLSHGIVGVNEVLATFRPDPLTVVRRAAEQALLPEMTLYLGHQDLAGNLLELAGSDKQGHVRIGGVKLFMDGCYSDRTAWTVDTYPESCSHGARADSDEAMLESVEWARRNGVQVVVHAMGDAAINRVIELVGDQEPWLGDVPSVRLDHTTLFTAEMLARVNAARMDFGVVSHSIFMFAEIDNYARNLSQKQFDVAYPLRSYYENVPHAALASDCPATAWADSDNVFTSIQAAVTRRAYNGADIGQAQAITVPQALLMYTGRARVVSGLTHIGRIVDDAPAHFLILDRDVFTVPAPQIGSVAITQTWIAGAQAWVST